jgi:L-alanine-DL-glutamate epimerase-like enolase superfamily enzyme
VPVYAARGATRTHQVQRGYRHLKQHQPAGKESPDEIVEMVRSGREQLGPDIPLYLDASVNWDWDTAAYIAKAVEPLDIGWLEEPLLADDLEGHRRLGELTTIPIAGGEHEYTMWGYRELLDHKALRVWQPDACWVGGMTALRDIIALGQANGIWVVPHRGSEVWGLHAILALADKPLAEGGRPWVTWVQGEPEIRDGMIGPPSGPGFGVSFDEALLRKPTRG